MTNKSRMHKSFITALICSLMLTMTVCFFSPLEVILTNSGEFRFPLENIWWLQLIIGIASALILALIIYTLPPKAGKICSAVILGIGVAMWVQMLFMNGKMVSLTGEEMSTTPTFIALNLLIWVVIIAAIIISVVVLIKKRKNPDSIMRGIAIALIFTQSVAFISLCFTRDKSNVDPDHTLTTEGEFQLSSGTNVIEFIIDTADGRTLQKTINNYPELNDRFSGWTWYPNTTSLYSRTYPSLTYMLTGEKCYFDREPQAFANDAFEKGFFLKRLSEASTDVRVFTMNPSMIGNNVSSYIANSSGYQYGLFKNLNIPGLEKNLANISLYKGMPYAFKDAFVYEASAVNMSSFKPQANGGGSYDHYRDPDFYAAFNATPPTVTKDYSKAFRFYHLFGNHPGVNWDENLQPNQPNDRVNALRGSLRLVESFADYMKDIGVYDDAFIIVTADHGSSGGGETLRADIPACPILLVKYPNSDKSQSLAINNAPVAHEDLFASIEKALNVPVSGTGSGKALDEYSEGDIRKRYYNYSALYSDQDGEIALLEYEIEGDARNVESWKQSGRWWSIDYSFNKVSNQRYQDTAEYPHTEPAGIDEE